MSSVSPTPDYRCVDVYDRCREVKISQLYYEVKLTRWRRWHTWMELLIALGTTGGATGLAVWKSDPGQYAWLYLSGLAAILATIKPVINAGAQIDNLSKHHYAQWLTWNELEPILVEVNGSLTISPKDYARYVQLRQRIGKPLAEDPQTNKALRRKLEERVDSEFGRRFPNLSQIRPSRLTQPPASAASGTQNPP